MMKCWKYPNWRICLVLAKAVSQEKEQYMLLLLFSCYVMSDSLWPHELQHTRLLCPWDSQAITLGWVAISSSREASLPRNRLACRFFTSEPSGSPHVRSTLERKKTHNSLYLQIFKVSARRAKRTNQQTMRSIKMPASKDAKHKIKNRNCYLCVH